ncbi:hypothetical protein C8J56DRAFT_1165509 [Mycena floridula]|nr:hypothetical protein C8J56DRAFT_944792 [Mycena floridula]KAJ7586596.1 hypothetical protein C8J56DRAFT_1165509 [Mycena floridula]
MPHRVIPSFSMYSMIQHAVNHPGRAKDVVKHLAKSRTLCLAVLFGLFAYHAQYHRAADQVLALSAIVVTLCIGALYDGLDSESFEARITSIGVFGFTVMNSIPNLVTAGLVFRVMIIVSPSPSFIAAQILIILLPAIIQLTCDLVALRFMQRTRGT